MTRFFTTLLLLFVSVPTIAATVAIIDSGTDYKHEAIDPYVWTNPVDSSENNADEDGNGYIDDVYGWNFGDGNNQVIDYKYLGTFSNDVKKFFDLQLKALEGTITEEEKEWVRSKIQDQQFVAELSKFGNFIHGSHVTGIAIHGTVTPSNLNTVNDNDYLAVKLLSTEPPVIGGLVSMYEKPERGFETALMKIVLTQLAGQQKTLFVNAAAYINGHNAAVANGSFGFGSKQAEQIVIALYKQFAGREPTKEELHELKVHVLSEMVKNGIEMCTTAPNTLFVFAAGNDGTDNDIYPAAPASAGQDNSMSVAATHYNTKIARFSNFGASAVDVAAPGVGILSSIPGTDFLKFSGTSQAAPYVTYVASMVKDTNPSLTPLQIKTIIMETVDKKLFLQGIVKAGGIANLERAVTAAKISFNRSLDSAIAEARTLVPDQRASVAPLADEIYNEMVLPLPSTIRLN